MLFEFVSTLAILSYLRLTEEGESQESAPHPKQVLYIDLDGEVEQYDILRKKEAE